MSYDTPVQHNPLPHDHMRGQPHDSGFPSACQLPENKGTYVFMAGRQCPGCRAYAMAMAVADPTGTVTGTKHGRSVNRVERIRANTDELDPMRVLFERALMARWGSEAP